MFSKPLCVDYITSVLSRFAVIERAIFGVSMLLGLAPLLFSGTYFVAGDGPCHVYNAHVLLDWLQGRNLDFFRQYYAINPHFDPNWWTHGWLIVLQCFLAPPLAEKVFLAGYVLAFGFGLRFLIRQVNPENMWLSSAGMFFCWHHLLMMGFYNYSWSLAGMFWMSGWWLKHSSKPDWKGLLVLMTGWVALYSMHPVGLAFCGLITGISILANAISRTKNNGFQAGFRAFGYQTGFLLLSALPALILTVQYLFRQNWVAGGNEQLLRDALDALGTLTMLITMNVREHPWVNLVVFILLSVFIVAAMDRLRSRKWQLADAWLVFTFISFAIYCKQVGPGATELLMPLRLQLFPWIGLLIWSATARFKSGFVYFISTAVIALQVVLLASRLPAHQAASRLENDWLSVADSIAPNSFVLVINYDYNGTDETGLPIGDRIWLFNHAVDYLGAQRPGIVMADNYEAHLQYFPLTWLPESNPYALAAVEGTGFENRPPRVDLAGYPARARGKKIGYVLLLGQTEQERNSPYGQELMLQLRQGYNQIAASSAGKAILYRLGN